MSNKLPNTYHADRTNYGIANIGGLHGQSVDPRLNAIKPTTLVNRIGHAITRGPNSPSQLTHTFGR